MAINLSEYPLKPLNSFSRRTTQKTKVHKKQRLDAFSD